MNEYLESFFLSHSDQNTLIIQRCFWPRILLIEPNPGDSYYEDFGLRKHPKFDLNKSYYQLNHSEEKVGLLPVVYFIPSESMKIIEGAKSSSVSPRRPIGIVALAPSKSISPSGP